MINTIEEAKTHANHVSLTKYKNVIVFPDGSIHASDSDLSALITEDSFIVKGELKGIEKKVKKSKEIKSDDII